MSKSASFTWPGRDPADPAHARALAFLVMDIQRSPAAAGELCAEAAAVAEGRAPEWERTGNAYFLRLTPREAIIEDMVDEESAPLSLPLAEFRAAAEAWRAHLESAG